jgi:subtilase family serine protease
MDKRARTALFSVCAISGLTAIAACSSSGAGQSTTASATASDGFATPMWATASHFVARVPAATPMTVQVHFRLRNEAAADATLAAITNPDDPRSGQYLSDEEFDLQYGPTDADVATLRAHLESHGLQVTELPKNRAYVAASGTAAQLEQTFGTRLANYSVNGETRHAPMDKPTLPEAIAPRVAGILGLATANMKPHTVTIGGATTGEIEPQASSAPSICSEWYGQQLDTTDAPYAAGYPNPLPYAQCGYRPALLRQAYGFDTAVRKGNDGSGQTIAIIDAYESPTLFQDAQTYAANNDPDYPLAATQFTAQMAPGTASPIDKGWYGEQTLDVEAVHSMAPGANIAYVGAQSSDDQDLIAAINLVLTSKLATIISNSYGGVEQGANDYTVWESIAKQAGLKGIGVYFASGDSGDEAAGNGGTPSADFPTSLPEVTAVGATSLAMGQSGQRVFEVGWETAASRWEPIPDAGTEDGGVASTWTPGAPGGYVYGSGGGVSVVYLQPKYQAGIVPDSLSTTLGAQSRVVPDVSMLGDPITGFLLGETSPRSGIYGESVIGGTSLACPLFAGVMAVTQQHIGKQIGQANTRLYRAYKKVNAFSDIAPSATLNAVAVRAGVVATFDYEGLTIHTAVGYDNVTGLGTPNGATFLAAMK